MLKVDPVVFKSNDEIKLVPVSENEQYLSQMHDYSKLDEFYRYLEFDAFKSLDETREYLQSLIDRSSSKSGQYWFIFLPKEDVVVGTIGLHSLDAKRLSIEVGYGLSPHYQGRGIFSKALNIILCHCFEDLGLARIVARTDVDNLGSIKGLISNGFKKEGIMRNFYRYPNEKRFSDCVILSKLIAEHEVKRS